MHVINLGSNKCCFAYEQVVETFEGKVSVDNDQHYLLKEQLAEYIQAMDNTGAGQEADPSVLRCHTLNILQPEARNAMSERAVQIIIHVGQRGHQLLFARNSLYLSTAH